MTIISTNQIIDSGDYLLNGVEIKGSELSKLTLCELREHIRKESIISLPMKFNMSDDD